MEGVLSWSQLLGLIGMAVMFVQYQGFLHCIKMSQILCIMILHNAQDHDLHFFMFAAMLFLAEDEKIKLFFPKSRESEIFR